MRKKLFWNVLVGLLVIVSIGLVIENQYFWKQADEQAKAACAGKTRILDGKRAYRRCVERIMASNRSN